MVGCGAPSVQVYNGRAHRDQALGQTLRVRGDGTGPAFTEPGEHRGSPGLRSSLRAREAGAGFLVTGELAKDPENWRLQVVEGSGL